MEQLVCLVDGRGRVVRSSRALERPLSDLHELLHPRCSDPECYLTTFWQNSAASLAKEHRAELKAWDRHLGRQVVIRAQALAPSQDSSDDCFAVITVEQHAETPAQGDALRTVRLSEWMKTEEALRVTRAQLWRLSAQHLTIQETERRRIAAELHDGLGQYLSLVKLSLEEAATSVKRGAAGTAKVFERLMPQVRSALGELRRVAMNLRPSTLDDLGIVATLSWYFREFETASPGVTVERDVSVNESDVPEVLKIAIFRIVQEATGNARKHAQASRIGIALKMVSGSLELSIEDNGCGFEPASVAGERDFGHGLGLQTMRERAELSGASYEFESATGKGTRIRVRWPLSQAAENGCPVLPAARASMATCSPSPLHGSLPENFSACLACIRSLGGQ